MLWQTIAYFLILGIASHWIGEALPRKWFLWNRFPYRPWRWERQGRIYESLQIRAWKDRLPDKSRLIRGMVPKRVGICPTSASVCRLIRETCVAEAVHAGLCLGALPLLLGVWGRASAWLALAYVLGNLPFMMIQRYNRPALVSLAERLKKREERRNGASAHSVGEHGGRT